MNVEVLADPEAVARRGAAFIADAARRAVEARGRFFLAVSGGTTPWRMLRLLAREEVPWARVELFQVDERVVDAASPDRNLGHVRETLLDHVPIPAGQVHAMPVDDLAGGLAVTSTRGGHIDRAQNAQNAQNIVAAYQATLRRVAGTPPVLDLVHLGLGEDGHTASLVPGDAALDVTDADVAVTGPYQRACRMTLTFPVLARARRVLWVVTGAAKRGILARLRAADPALPASRVPVERAVLLADRAAAGG